MNTCVAFGLITHVCTYVCVCHLHSCVLSVDSMDWGPTIFIALPLPWKSGDCHCSRLFVRRRPQKWPGPARACHWMLRTLSLLLLHLYTSGRALHMLDTFWLKPQMYDPRLPMDTLHALPVRCVCDIATVCKIGVSVGEW